MVFDRNAMNTGRRMQDFGLCDLRGDYQNTAKLRTKGWLVVAFLNPADTSSILLAKQLQEWTTISDKLVVVSVTLGERAQVQEFASAAGITYPVLWDFEAYVAPLWAVSGTPTLFIMNDQGVVLGRVLGADRAEVNAAREMLAETIEKAEEAARIKAEAEAKAKAEAEAKAKADAEAAANAAPAAATK